MSISALRIHDEVTRIVNAIGQGGGGGASTWEQLTNKPFNTLNSNDFEVDNGELKIKLDGANVESTLLLSTNATSETTHTVSNISGYDFIYICSYVSVSNTVVDSKILTVDEFKKGYKHVLNQTVISTIFDGNYRGTVQYVSDTQIIAYNYFDVISVQIYGIKIKALSSGGSSELPIATRDTLGGVKIGETMVVNLDGTLNVQYAPHNYSLTEHVVGTWVDGQTLYEKTYQILNYNKVGWNKTDLLLPEGCETVKKMNTTVSDNNGNVFTEYNVSNSDMIRSYFYGGEHFLTIGTNYPERPFNVYITIQYTKTTD